MRVLLLGLVETAGALFSMLSLDAVRVIAYHYLVGSGVDPAAVHSPSAPWSALLNRPIPVQPVPTRRAERGRARNLRSLSWPRMRPRAHQPRFVQGHPAIRPGEGRSLSWPRTTHSAPRPLIFRRRGDSF